MTGVSTTEAAGTYGAGTAIPVTVTFNEPVTVTGTPQLALNPSSGAVATYTGGSGTSTLTFTYTVATGDNATDLDYGLDQRHFAQRGHDQGRGGQCRRPDPTHDRHGRPGEPEHHDRYVATTSYSHTAGQNTIDISGTLYSQFLSLRMRK